jgi:hypothetical protein
MPLTDKVEVFTRKRENSSKPWDWVEMSVEDATKSGEDQFRCVECHQKIRLHQDRVGKVGAHPEHLKRNPQCSLSDPLR